VNLETDVVTEQWGKLHNKELHRCTYSSAVTDYTPSGIF
jgi:hypothetical protein